jgi:hypothetical protein
MAKTKGTVGREARTRDNPAKIRPDVEREYRINTKAQDIISETTREARQVIPAAVEFSRDKETVKTLAPDANKTITEQAQPGTEGEVSKAYGADPSNKYTVRYAVREIDDLVASNTDTGAINPDYPVELQPRDRTRAASRSQVANMAGNLVPDMLIEEFHSTDRGAPIIGQDAVVESGNGRIAALRRAVRDYPEKYQEYRDELVARAGERGLDQAAVSQMKNPVLVRIRLDEGNRVEFAREANTAGVLAMSETEQSRTDADRLKTGDILRFNLGATGDLATDIERRDNREFVRSFMGAVPETERGALMGKEGELTQAGNKRIQAAMFTKVYDDTQVAALHFESTDSNVKNITGGLMNSLGDMAKAEEMIRSGSRAEDLSITEDITVAVKTYKSVKDRDDMTVEMYLDQGQMFDEHKITPTQTKILKGLHERSRSSKKIKSWIGSWGNVVQQQPHPDQGTMFDTGGTDREVLIDAWLAGKFEGHEQAELL